MKKLIQLVLLTCIISLTASAQITINYGVFGGACDSATFFNAFANGGVQPYTFTFDFGDGNTQTLPGQQTSAFVAYQYAAPGVYNTAVYVMDNAGATDTATQVFTMGTALIVDVDIVNDDCSGGCTGSLSANVSGGMPPYFYSWSNGATTPTISGVCAGSYSLQVWDSSQCSFFGSFQIDSGLTYEVEKDDPSCQGADGKAYVTISGDPSIYTYLWSPGGSTDSVITGLTSGVYYVTVTDTGGCSISDSIALFDSCGTISGVVYSDDNGNGVIDAGDSTLAGVLVTLNPGNITTVSDASGAYSLNAPAFGTFTITVAPPDVTIYCSGLVVAQGTVSFPIAGSYAVLVSSGSPTSTGNDFAIEPPAAPCGTISGHVFNDLNGNAVEDPGEPGYAGAIIDLGNGQYASTDVNGDYSVQVMYNSTVNLSISPFAPNYYCGVSSPSYVQTFPTGGAGYAVTVTQGMPSSTGNNFGVTASSAGFDVGIYSVWTTQNISAGTNLSVWMDYKSNGNVTSSCVLRLEFDPLLTFISASINPSSIGADFLEWTFAPGTTPSWDCMMMEFSLDSSAVAGSVLNWDGNFSCGMMDDCPDNDSIHREFVVDFGPAKTGQAGNENAIYSYDQVKELPLAIGPDDRTFSYTISFQNVTSETAYNMLVMDTLSEHLDITTLSFPFSSMPYKLDIAPGNVLIFSYEDIALADTATDMSHSYGFIQYNILMKENLPVGTEIKNKATILFNGYDPIKTNEVVQKIADPSSIGTVDPDLQVDVFPNPNNGQFIIDLKENSELNARISLVDMVGAQIFTMQSQNQQFVNVDPGSLSDGVYLLQVETADQVSTQKVVINRSR